MALSVPAQNEYQKLSIAAQKRIDDLLRLTEGKVHTADLNKALMLPEWKELSAKTLHKASVFEIDTFDELNALLATPRFWQLCDTSSGFTKSLFHTHYSDLLKKSGQKGKAQIDAKVQLQNETLKTKKATAPVPVSNPGCFVPGYLNPDAPETPMAKTPTTIPAGKVSPSEKQYWWLLANPKIWSFNDISVDSVVPYTVHNKDGKTRKIAANFAAAKENDAVICYESHPTKKIVSLATVEKASDGKEILFRKTEDLNSPISLAEIKATPELVNMQFLRNPNGSLFKLTAAEYETIMNLIREDNPAEEDNPVAVASLTYDFDDFKSEVFMEEDELKKLENLLRQKKNIILQGAPGVGKTFAAKRLAYAMMGVKDESRIAMVQFHQNYSYEDFIMGFKPNEEGGFTLEEGIFYNFCRKAARDSEKDYFFIIDEINRGNLSKIFGELLMLIEKDYRGHSIQLAYNKKAFSVPDNLYIIGMMNTADRSLAMIDYALRRRFSFFTMKPGFESAGFKKIVVENEDKRMATVIEAVKRLNKEIEEDDSLGAGFCIGHSYFCGDSSTDNRLDNIVEFDLCPMLEEYWFDNKDKRESEQKKLLDALK